MTNAGHGWRSWRWVVAPLAAAALAAVLAARGYATIDGTRARLVTAERVAQAGVVRAGTVDHPEANLLRPPFALVAQIANRSSAAARLTITIDGHRVCEATVAGAESRRLDCGVERDWDASIRDHDVVVQSEAAGWALTSLELAVRHGATSGFSRVVVVPLGSRAYVRYGAVTVLLAWALLTAMFLLPFPERLPRAVRVIHAVAAAIVGLAFLAVAVAPSVSGYQALISTGTFVRWSCLIAAPQLAWAARALATGATERGLVPAPVKCALVALVVFAACTAVMQRRLHGEFQGNYSGFVHIAAHIFNDNPLLNARDDVRASLRLEDGTGYDAQFMYFITFDPFLRAYADEPAKYRSFIDAPPYRFGRIGFSLLTKILSFDRWPRYPATMVWLVIAALGVCAFMLAWLAVQSGGSPAWGLLVLLVPGFWQSLSSALPEPLAAAFLIGGYWCATRGRWLAGALLFAAAVLVREVAVIVVFGLLAEQFLSGRRRRALVSAVVALLPVAAWRLYVGWVLFPDWGWRGFFVNPHDFAWPLGGFVDLWSRILAGAYEPGMTVPGIALPVLLIGALALAGVIAIRKPSALALAAVAYAAMAVSLNYEKVWSHVGDGQRLTYEVFLLLALLSPSAVTTSRAVRLLVYGFWFAAAWYVFFGSAEASFVREALVGG